ncbi:MAG TPA: AAA family ATPase, partial [Candidatus Baltobacteraceae bacterium]|nr:AAA family ATPase [Candidatus Baltobacteraceae bacterium]
SRWVSMQSLKDMLVESKVFANREVLSPHFIPKKLIFREKEINNIERAIAPALKGERGRNLFIYGKTGTGKTSCARYVIEEVRDIPNTRAKISYINCKIYNSRYRVLNKIVSDHLPTYAKRGYGAVDLYEKLTSWIEEDNKILVIILDEVDVVKDLDDLIYTLTRINSDIKAGGVTIIGISNKVSFKEALDPRSLSTLYETELVFAPYYATELYAIIKDRAAGGFKSNVISDDILHFIAASAAKEGGDARLSLKILSRVGEITEERNLDKVSMKEATDASRMAENDIVYELIATLPEHHKLVLYAIAILTQSGGSYKKLTDGVDTYLFSGEVYNRYKSITESLRKEAKSERWYRKYLSELEMQGLITAFESGKGIRGHTKLIKLMYPPQKTKDVLEKDIMGYEKDKEGEEKNSGA